MARAQRLAGKIKIDQFKDKKPLNLDILDDKGFNSTRNVRPFQNTDFPQTIRTSSKTNPR